MWWRGVSEPATCRVTTTRNPTQRPTAAGVASWPGQDWPDPEECSGPNNKQPTVKQAITSAASQFPRILPRRP